RCCHPTMARRFFRPDEAGVLCCEGQGHSRLAAAGRSGGRPASFKRLAAAAWTRDLNRRRLPPHKSDVRWSSLSSRGRGVHRMIEIERSRWGVATCAVAPALTERSNALHSCPACGGRRLRDEGPLPAFRPGTFGGQPIDLE